MNKKQLMDKRIIVNNLEDHFDTLNKKEKMELLRLKCQIDFLTFARFITNNEFKPYPVHKIICDFIQKIGDGDKDMRRTVISLPPRSGKSLLISKIFPAWQMGRAPRAEFIMSSYSMGLSTENSRAVLDFVTSEKFAWIFPSCTIPKKGCNLTTIRTRQGGIIKVASASGNVTGFGYGNISHDELPGVGILDDLLADGNSATVMDSTYDWVQTQFLTRALPNNAIISMGTRFHRDDVAGRLIAAAPDDWKILNIPALCVDTENDPLERQIGESHWPEFFPVSTLNIIKKSIGDQEFSALYQGSPVTESGSIFKDFWFPTHSDNGSLELTYRYLTIDTAYKEKSHNDYACICIWGFVKKHQKLYLMDYKMDRLDFPDLQKLVVDIVKKYKIRAVYIEGRASGMPLIQSLKRAVKVTIKELVPIQDKVLRANSVAPFVENGLVSLYENLYEFDERMNDLCSFPFIKNDDFVDAFIYGIQVMRDDLGVKISTYLENNIEFIGTKDENVVQSPAVKDLKYERIGLKDKKIPSKSVQSKIRTIDLPASSSKRIIYR